IAAAALSLAWDVALAAPQTAEPFTVYVPVGQQTAILVGPHVGDADGDLDWSTFALTSSPQSGTTGLEPGVIHYSAVSLTPTVPDSLTYRICDLAGDCVLGDVEIWVGVVAQDDDFVVTDGTTTVLDVLANDFVATAAPGDPSTLTLINSSQSFQVVNGAIVYTSAPGFNGTDGVNYSVCTTDGTCGQAVVRIDVQGPTPPVAVNDPVEVTFGNTVTILPLANDTDAGGDLIPQVTIISVRTVGIVNQVAPDTIEYTPGFSGSTVHAIDYRICDQAGSCDSASIIITVLPLPPGARADSVTVAAGDTIEIDVLANDTFDPAWLDTTNFSVTLTDESQTSIPPVRWEQGTPGVVYTAPATLGGPDSFWYTVCHTNGGCESTTVAVSVVHPSGFTSPLVAFFETDQSLQPGPDGTYRIDVLSNVVPSGSPIDPSSVVAVTQPVWGSFASDAGIIVYTPGSVPVSELDFRY
ncbi:MAG: Ig-like domain-containing protein, partial [Acidimicrobiales bacterium]